MFIDIYRVEKNNDGIYGQVNVKPLQSGQLNDVRPMPWDDGIPGVESSEFFAFDSIDALERWFGNSFEIFRQANAVICRYRVHIQHVRFGRRQCVFKKEFAVLLESVNVF